MDRAAIITGIESALGEVLGDQVFDVSEGTLLLGELGLDSTAILELLMAMEETLGIAVDTDNIKMETFTTIGTLADYVSATARPDAESVHPGPRPQR